MWQLFASGDLSKLKKIKANIVIDVRETEKQALREHLNSNQELGFIKSFICLALEKAKWATYPQACREQLSPVFID